jgi:hypothetical protein
MSRIASPLRQPQDHVAEALARAAQVAQPVDNRPVESDEPFALLVDLDPSGSAAAIASKASAVIAMRIISACP